MRRIIFIAVCVFLGGMLLINSMGCSVYDPYRYGKVIDSNTREPIEGAVVKGQWRIDYFPLYLTMGPSFDYATRTTVTDEDGNFCLGLGPWLYPGLLYLPFVEVNKEGYKNISVPWRTERSLESEYACSPTYEKYGVEWKNDRLYIPLRKPDVEE